MTLWIVEDDDMHLSTVLKAIEKEFPETFEIFVNRDITWPKDSPLPVLAAYPRKPDAPKPGDLPEIVILDLLLETKPAEGESKTFAGGPFYERLRDVERAATQRRRSQVIVYSQFRGLACTEHFVNQCCAEDNHFDDVIKSPALLMQKLERARQKILDGE
jgi:hypothetical protein